jgi:DNA-binding NtrC family response regulator
MNKNGTIIIIEDDEDDQHVLEEVLKELGYKITSSISRTEFSIGTSSYNQIPFLSHPFRC